MSHDESTPKITGFDLIRCSRSPVLVESLIDKAIPEYIKILYSVNEDCAVTEKEARELIERDVKSKGSCILYISNENFEVCGFLIAVPHQQQNFVRLSFITMLRDNPTDLYSLFAYIDCIFSGQKLYGIIPFSIGGEFEFDTTNRIHGLVKWLLDIGCIPTSQEDLNLIGNVDPNLSYLTYDSVGNGYNSEFMHCGVGVTHKKGRAGKMFGHLDPYSLWDKSVLVVSFENKENSEGMRIIKEAAAEWNSKLKGKIIHGLQFKVIDEYSQREKVDILVGFNKWKGNWSLVGCNDETEGITLNLDPSAPSSFNLRQATHELGHALGMLHEHQHPLKLIVYNQDAVYKHFLQPPNNWTIDTVDQQILNPATFPCDKDELPDTESVMHYALDPTFIQIAPTLENFKTAFKFEELATKAFRGIFTQSETPSDMDIQILSSKYNDYRNISLKGATPFKEGQKTYYNVMVSKIIAWDEPEKQSTDGLVIFVAVPVSNQKSGDSNGKTITSYDSIQLDKNISYNITVSSVKKKIFLVIS